MATVTLTTLSDFGLNADLTDGGVTLRDALTFGNAGDTIVFDPSLAFGTIRLVQGALEIDKSFTIDAANTRIRISGDVDDNDITDGSLGNDITDAAASLDADLLGDNTRIFDITNAGEVAITGLVLSGGVASENDDLLVPNTGGAVRAEGTALTLTDVTLAGNAATGPAAFGAGIYTDSALNIVNSRLTGNLAVGNAFAKGGAVHVRAPSDDILTISGSTITNNRAEATLFSGTISFLFSYCGGIYSSYLVLDNSIVSDNFTNGSCGGIFVRYDATITTCTINGNVAENDAGGGVRVDQNLELIGSTVSGNQVMGESAAGGGVFAGNLTAINSTIARKNGKRGRSCAGSNCLAKGQGRRK